MEKPLYPSDAQDRFMVRLPDGMRDRIAEAAKANGRSMNAEIIDRLGKSFVRESPNLGTLEVMHIARDEHQANLWRLRAASAMSRLVGLNEQFIAAKTAGAPPEELDRIAARYAAAKRSVQKAEKFELEALNRLASRYALAEKMDADEAWRDITFAPADIPSDEP